MVGTDLRFLWVTIKIKMENRNLEQIEPLKQFEQIERFEPLNNLNNYIIIEHLEQYLNIKKNKLLI